MDDLTRLRTSAFLLLQHGEDYQGVLPGWIVDCRRDLERGFAEVEALTRQLEERDALIRTLDKGFRLADSLVCNAITWGGYYVGDGLLSELQAARAALATEARRAETGTGSVHDGAGPQDNAQPSAIRGGE